MVAILDLIFHGMCDIKHEIPRYNIDNMKRVIYFFNFSRDEKIISLTAAKLTSEIMHCCQAPLFAFITYLSDFLFQCGFF